MVFYRADLSPFCVPSAAVAGYSKAELMLFRQNPYRASSFDPEGSCESSTQRTEVRVVIAVAIVCLMLWSFHFGLGSVLRGGLVFWLLPLGYFVCCNLGRAHRWFSLLPIFVIAFSILLFTCRCWIDHQVIVRSMFELADFERRKSFTSLSYSLLSICFPANLVVWIFLGWRQTVFSRQGKGVGSKKSADDSVGKN